MTRVSGKFGVSAAAGGFGFRARIGTIVGIHRDRGSSCRSAPCLRKQSVGGPGVAGALPTRPVGDCPPEPHLGQSVGVPGCLRDRYQGPFQGLVGLDQRIASAVDACPLGLRPL